MSEKLSDKFTARNVAKTVVKMVIASKTAGLTERLLTDYTSLDEDSMTVDVAGHVVGWGVASQLKPLTDKIVDKTFDYIAEKRNDRQSKTSTPEKTD